jgi:hypothetical protein
MEGETFDDLVKRLTATRLSRLDALRGLLASAAVGLTGATLAAADARKKSKAAGKKGGKKAKVGGKGKAKDRKGKAQDKVIICHNGQTLAVAAPAVPAHLAHGDTIGPCSDAGAGTCVPLLQVCVPLVGNPCCDANASCVMSAAGDVTGLPDFACRDNSTTDCTSDAECHARFANSDVVCRENIGGSLCPPVPHGQENRVRHCCAPKACDTASECFSNLCCKPFVGLNTCCAIGQFCNRIGGCFTG